MRLQIKKSGVHTNFYVLDSTYDPKTKKSSTKITQKLGNEETICKREGVEDAEAWARDYVEKLKEKKNNNKGEFINITLSTDKKVQVESRRIVNAGQLIIQKILSELKISEIANAIIKDSKSKIDMEDALVTLVSSRMLSPGSKLHDIEVAKSFPKPSDISLHQSYRALSLMADKCEDIQAMLYKNSEKVCKRDTHILYYDCTNFFFETTCEDEPDNLRQYGVSKEHRPNPIVGMGLFMDAKGIPLAFDIYPGNKNEQLTMCPIEERIKKDFGKSEFIAVTDAGLSSRANKRFNSEGGRAYITTQSLKKLSKDLQEWALAKDGWRLARSKKTYTIDEIEDDFVKNYNRIFYKERMIKADGKDALEEKLIVTFSLKYREYCANIRDKQVRRAEKKLERGISTVNRKSQNDPARFIECRSITGDGEVATNTVAHINEDKVAKEAVFDGFYAVSTSLVDEGSVSEILKINKNRWEIEECFRIMKTEFEARPVYLSRQERIKAHFLVCFIALLVYRILEQKLGYKYTCDQILNALKSMQLAEFKGFGYACIYNPTEITDAMHEVCGFRTDTEGLTYRDMKNIIARSKWEKVIDTESK